MDLKPARYPSYHDLIVHRVHEILLVASPYDAYILEEDGRLTEQILDEYLGMNLSYAPRAWRASTAAEAMEMLSKRKYDLVITLLRILGMDPITFGSEVKKKFPRMPVILLAFDTSELKQLPDPIPEKSIDKLFIWTGDASVFPVIIKHIEDKLNVMHDVKRGDVRAIIVVENNPYYYSIILPRIYSELLYHTRNLLDRSLNDTHRLLRMRARPKILLASTYEEAEAYFRRFQENLLGIITDVRFPRNGRLDRNAGFELARWIRQLDSSMPIMLQSSDEEWAEKAKQINAQFLNKKSKTLLKDLRKFMVENFGFGDFVFRLPSGEEVARATNLLELQEKLATVPGESLLHHASRNHFSNWLAARGEFWIASKMRPVRVSDFVDVDSMRDYLVDAIDSTRRGQHRGRVVEFSKDSFDPSATFIRIGGGSLGGKARGLAFAHSIIAKSDLGDKFPDVTIRIPKIAVIGTDEFDEFMSHNDLWDFALKSLDNKELRKRFLRGKLSRKLVHNLKLYFDEIDYPVAVRSSGLFEDLQYQSLAGMYSTFMLPNCSQDPKEKLRTLCDAIKLVFASTFYEEPKSILESSFHRQEDEKMAVIVQELVGQTYGNRFYPNFSGVAQSVNCYPVSYMKRDEGVVYVALGLGRTIVEGRKSLYFSPQYPSILPAFYSPDAMLENTQREFYALSLDSERSLLEFGEKENPRRYDLKDAEQDGTLRHVGSVLIGDNIVRDSLNYEGVRVVTFASILKFKTFPITDIVQELLEIGKHALGCPVEFEFAVNIFDSSDKKDEFCLLQIRPMAIDSLSRSVELKDLRREEIFCKSGLSLGNGIIEDIRDIIFVKPKGFDTAKTRRIAREIANFNNQMGLDRPYMLIGPGRWGSADPWLGIPVAWNQISGAKVIAEVGLKDLNVDPSFGGHFFQNVTSLRLGYLTVKYGSRTDFIDWNWLNQQPCHEETPWLKWVRLDRPLSVHIDGRTGEAIAVKHEA